MVSAVSTTAAQNEPKVRANAGKNQVIIEGSKYTFKVTGKGNVPHYQFYENAEAATTAQGQGNQAEDEPEPENVIYHVKFVKLVEFNDTNENEQFDAGEQVPGGGHTLALPSVDWDYSIDEDTQTFTFTAPEETKPWIQLTNHYDDENMLKFDIELREWQWIREDSELALRFDVTASAEQEADVTVNAETTGVSFEFEGETAYFVSSLTAEIDEESADVGVTVSIAEEDNGAQIYLSYPHFSDSIYHDPTVGFGDLLVSEFSILPISFLVMGISIIGIDVMLMFRRRD